MIFIYAYLILLLSDNFIVQIYSSSNELHNVYSILHGRDPPFPVTNLCPKLQAMKYNKETTNQDDWYILDDFNYDSLKQSSTLPDCTFRSEKEIGRLLYNIAFGNRLSNLEEQLISLQKVRLIAALMTDGNNFLAFPDPFLSTKLHTNCDRRLQFNLELDKRKVIIIPRGICKIPYRHINWTLALAYQNFQPILWQFPSGNLGITFPEMIDNRLTYKLPKHSLSANVHLIFKIVNGNHCKFIIEHYKIIPSNQDCEITQTEGCDSYDCSIEYELYKKIYQIQGDFIPADVFDKLLRKNQLITNYDKKDEAPVSPYSMFYSVIPIPIALLYCLVRVCRALNERKDPLLRSTDQNSSELIQQQSTVWRGVTNSSIEPPSSETVIQQSDDPIMSESYFSRLEIPIDVNSFDYNKDLPPTYDSIQPPTYDEVICFHKPELLFHTHSY